METVLVCVAPEADYSLYELLQRQLQGPGWQPLVMPADAVTSEALPPVAAVIAHATDWPDEQLHSWLAAIRAAVGPRKRLLAVLPRPPASYPAETQALWSHAVGYGTRWSEVVAWVDEVIAGRA